MRVAMSSAEKAMVQYSDAYQKLYKRLPKDLRTIDEDWVIVNGARMRVIELETLTKQLQQEFKQGLAAKRGVVSKLLSFFKQS
jgi:hypothetical protein